MNAFWEKNRRDGDESPAWLQVCTLRLPSTQRRQNRDRAPCSGGFKDLLADKGTWTERHRLFGRAASNASARRVKCSGTCGGGNMTEKTKESGYLCDCEHRLPCAVLTLLIRSSGALGCSARLRIKMGIRRDRLEAQRGEFAHYFRKLGVMLY
jgi:hypothetical protein